MFYTIIDYRVGETDHLLPRPVIIRLDDAFNAVTTC